MGVHEAEISKLRAELVGDDLAGQAELAAGGSPRALLTPCTEGLPHDSEALIAGPVPLPTVSGDVRLEPETSAMEYASLQPPVEMMAGLPPACSGPDVEPEE